MTSVKTRPTDLPALLGGHPVREEFLPLARPEIGPEERAELLDTLDSDWLSRGPKTKRFEDAFAASIGAKQAIGVSSCTAGLHAVLLAAGVGPGDEVISTPMTFVATVNAIVYCGATPVLADIDPRTLNMDPESLARKITPRTKAVVPVHFAGQACRMDAIMDIAEKHGLFVLEDAAHAAGSLWRGRPAGTLGHAAVFSFYATKNITTGDGGMVTTDDERLAETVRVLCFHGLSTDAWLRFAPTGNAAYQMEQLGFKYNMTDIEAALGLAQLGKLDRFVTKRRSLAARYDAGLADCPRVSLTTTHPDAFHSRHLYPVLLDLDSLTIDRDGFVTALKAEGIGAGIHYQAVHHHPYYRRMLGDLDKDLPQATLTSDRIFSLPLCPRMNEADADDCIAAVKKLLTYYKG